MTREKAAKICQSIKFILDKEDYSEEVEEALNMAIAALKQLSLPKIIIRQGEQEPSAQPFTSEQIQTMQEIEAAQVEKAYELGKADRPTGRWHIEPGIGCFCSKCSFDIGNDLDFMEYVHYCPNCGADMRGGPTLTPEEFAEKMAGIAENGDEERKHVAADSIMCELLKSLGFGEGVGIFEDMDKWYS